LNAKKLVLQIENKVYYNTNSTWNSREVIDTAPSIMYRIESPYPAVTTEDDDQPMGIFIITYHYEFVSRHQIGQEFKTVNV